MTGLVKVSSPIAEYEEAFTKEGQSIWWHFNEFGLQNKPVMCLMNGEPILRKDWDILLTEKDNLQFVILPQGGGGGRKLLATVAGIALSVFAPYAAGVLGAALGITSAIGISLLTAGIMVVGSLLINALMPTATPGGQQGPSSSDLNASPTYSISAQGNTARLLQPIPKLYGTHILYPDFASMPWQDYEANEQYLYQLFCLGLGEYDVHQVRIEDTLVWDEVNGLSDSFSDVEIEICPPGQAITLFPAAVISAVEVSGQEMDVQNEWLGPFIINPGDQDITKIQVDFVANRGIYYMNDKGNLNSLSISVEVEARQVDAGGNPIGDFVLLGSHTYTRANATPQRMTESYEVTRGRYEVRARRTSSKSTSTRYADQIAWQDVKGFVPDDNTFSDITVMAVKIRSSNQLSNQSSRRFNVIQTAKIPVWDGNTWSAPQNNNNIAWVAADILRNTLYGAGLPDSRIDLSKLLYLSQIYDQRGDEFNGVFDTKKTIWDAVSSVLRAGRTQPLMIGGLVTFVRDEQATLPKALITPRNIIKDSFSMNHILYSDDSPDSVIVEFFDGETWRQNEVLCKLPESQADKPARIKMFGVTSRDQAWREGIYQAAVNLYRRVFSSIDMEMEGRLLLRGDTIMLSHDLPQWGFFADIDSWDPDTRTVTLSEKVIGDKCEISKRNGGYWGPVSVVVSESGLSAVIDEEDLLSVEAQQGPIPIYTGYNQEPTRIAFGNTTQYAKKFKVVGTRSKNKNVISIDLTIDDDRVYGVDDGSPPIELDPLGPGIASTGPTVQNIIVSQDPLSLTNPVTLNASWLPSFGANTYVTQVSSDGIIWFTVHEGPETEIQFQTQGGPVYIRVAAIGDIKGPWASPNPNPVTYGELPIEPAAPGNLVATADVDNGNLSIMWDSTIRATSYRVRVYTESATDVYDILQLDRNVNTISTIFSSSDISGAGGPWSNIKVTVEAYSEAGGYGEAAEQIIEGIGIPAPQNLSLASVYHGFDINIQWSAVNAANSYIVYIYEGGVQRSSYNVLSTSYVVSASELNSIGGPWRALEVRVKAISGSLESAESVLQVTDPAPAVPGNIIVSSTIANTVNVSFDTVPESDIVEYVIYGSTTSGFTPNATTEVYRGTSNNVDLTNFATGETAYIVISAEDMYSGKDNFNYSIEYSQVVL